MMIGPVRRAAQKVGIVGAPLWRGQMRSGVGLGPKYLRENGLIKKLQAVGCNAHDYGDLEFPEVANDSRTFNMKNPRSVGAANKIISDAVRRVFREGLTPLTLGGDHSVAVGTVHGHAKRHPNLCVLWVDAHGDVNPPQASVSGNIHGMPLAFLLRELADHVPKMEGFEWLTPCLSVKDVAYIGQRDLDPAERYIINQHGIATFDMQEIDRYGIASVLEKALKAINPNMDRPIHLSFDIDSLDPKLAPCTGTPVSGGLTLREGVYLTTELAATGKLSAVDLVEVNPELGRPVDAKQTASSAIDVITACFGRHRGGNLPPNYELPKL